MFKDIKADDIERLQKRIWNEPGWFSREILGENPWEGQDRMMESVRDNVRTAISACHAVGKTRGAARVVPWFLFGQKYSKIITTAPTWRQVEKLLWAEIRGILKAAPYELGLQVPPKAPEAYISPTWYAIGLSTNQPERFQGFHAPAILIILDEASGIDDTIWEAIQGIMASGQIVRVLLLSNPTKATGFFAAQFRNPLCKKITLGCFDTPNFASIREEYEEATDVQAKLAILRSVPDTDLPWPTLIKPSFVADLLEEFGEDSDIFRVRALGLFPKGDPNQLITIDDFTRAANTWAEIDMMDSYQASEAAAKGKRFPWWRFRAYLSEQVSGGLDIARFGSASSVLSAQALLTSMPQIVYPPQKTTDLSGHVAQDIERFQIHRTTADESGLGGGPCDQLPTMAPGIIPFNGGRAAFNPRMFPNLRSEQFWHLRKLFQEKLIAVQHCDKAMGQLTSIRYSFLTKGERRIETKEEMAARGIHRMDEADSHMMSYCQVPGADYDKLPSLAHKATDWGAGFR